MNAGRNIPRLRHDNLVAIARVISEQQEQAAEASKTNRELSITGF